MKKVLFNKFSMTISWLTALISLNSIHTTTLKFFFIDNTINEELHHDLEAALNSIVSTKNSSITTIELVLESEIRYEITKKWDVELTFEFHILAKSNFFNIFFTKSESCMNLFGSLRIENGKFHTTSVEKYYQSTLLEMFASSDKKKLVLKVI
jgi:hypothetical protein